MPQSSVADALRWTKPNDAVDVLFIDDAPCDLQLPASVELEVTETEPGLRGDTASGGGNKPATLETGATVHVPLFVNIGDRVKVRRAHRRLHVARVTRTAGRQRMARRSDQRRAAVFALYQADVTERELDDVFERDASHVHARARLRRRRTTPRSSTRSSSATPRAGRSTASRRWRRRSCASRCSRCCTPTSRPADTPIPPEGAIDEAVETAKTFCGADAPGFVNGILAAALREMRDNPEAS